VLKADPLDRDGAESASADRQTGATEPYLLHVCTHVN